MTKVAAIETKGLCIGYLLKGGKRKVVHEDLNLQLVSGEVTCLLGLNGAGKSTLLRTLCGFQPPLGIKIRRTRILILLCTGLLTATTTAFCGPISFIGLAVPHVARLMLGSSNHKMLVPVTLLTGSCIALLCNLLMVLPGTHNILPLNAVTPMLGAPVIIYVIVNRKNIQYFD